MKSRAVLYQEQLSTFFRSPHCLPRGFPNCRDLWPRSQQLLNVQLYPGTVWQIGSNFLQVRSENVSAAGEENFANFSFP
jgi:hypothetical protein